MRAFAIYNPLERERRAAAWILYEPGTDRYSVEVAEWATSEDLPLLFALFVEDGQRTISDRWVRPWIEERMPPENRDNIIEVLDSWGIVEYYRPLLLVDTKGRSSRDDFLLEEVPADRYRTFDLNRTLESPVAFGTQLSRARRAADLTQAQLAEKCGIQQAVISRIERGQGNPTLETMEILARGCGRTLGISLE